MAELKRYRAIEGMGHTSHPLIRPGFVGYRRVIDNTEDSTDFVVPGGHRFRRMVEGEVLQDSAYLRARVSDGALELLPLHQPEPKSDEPRKGGSKNQPAPKTGAESEV